MLVKNHPKEKARYQQQPETSGKACCGQTSQIVIVVIDVMPK